jgi:outer membrane protein OmpA-like peptidoglycan-associated protein
MKRSNQALRISIPKPCSENWENMDQREKGRFCSSCEKDVIDFSGLTDKELLYYFSNTKTTSCGRFHQSQLNTALLQHEIKSNSWSHIYRKVAAVLAFLSLKPSGSMAQGSPQTVIQPTLRKSNIETTTPNATISGTVKTWQGIAIEGADILFDNKVVAKSNQEGRFSFDLVSESSSKISTILVSYPAMAPVVRNYHPAMQSTSYDIVLRKETEGSNPYLGGWITVSYEFDAVDLNFSEKSSSLKKSCAGELEQLAVTLRNNPNLTVQFIGYGKTTSEINLVRKRQQEIKNYLTEKEGIDGTRLKMMIKAKQSGRSNTIEIAAYNENE